MGSAGRASSKLLLAALVAGCRRTGEEGRQAVAAEPAITDAAPSSPSSFEAASAPTICRDGRLFDHDGRGISLRSSDPRDPHDPVANGVELGASRDARLSLYGTVSARTGPLSEVQLARETCRQYQAEARCFLDEMKSTPRFAGTVDLEVKVGVDGVVTTTRRTNGTLASASLAECLSRAFAELRFPVAATATSFVSTLTARSHPLLSASPVSIVQPGVRVSGPGSFGAVELLGIVSANLAPIEGCYERGLETEPGLKGQVMVTFDIEEKGVVSHVITTAGTTMPAKVNSCVLSAISALVFPAPSGGGVSVQIPLVFENAP